MAVAVKKILGVLNAAVKKADGVIASVTYANLTDLLHFNGTDTSTTITNERTRSWSVVGNAQLDTAQAKFGTASLLCDGNGDGITASDSTDFYFSTGNFTIDCWVMLHAQPTTGNSMSLFIQRVDSDNKQWLVYDDASGVKRFRYIVQSGGSVIVNVGANYTFTLDTWTHIAVVRNGNAWNLYVNGTSINGITDTDAVPDFASAVYIGTFSGAGTDGSWNGWIDEFRISKGTAQWTANFTAPTAEYRINALKKISAVSNV